MSTLNDILSDEPMIDEPVEALEAQEPPVQPDASARDEQGRFIGKGEEKSASPAPAEELKPELEHPALLGERRRRQEAEARLAEMEAQINARPAQPAPTLWEDEAGWQQHFGSQIVTQATLNARLDMSEMMARRDNPDFDQMRETFLALAKDNPTLADQARADPHPWERAYKIAKNHETMKQLGAVDVASLEEKLRAQILSEMSANSQPTSPVPNIPASLADHQSSRGNAPTKPTGPPSLDQILGKG